MSTEIELERLRRDVQYLKDRADILDCIAAHARGCDRHDVSLLTSTYHDDGIDEHGKMKIPGPGYAAWANAVHGATSQAHMQSIGSISWILAGSEKNRSVQCPLRAISS